MNGSGAGSEFSFFVSVQFQFYNLFNTVLAKDNGNTDADIRFSVFTFQIYRARNHLLLVMDDGFNHISTCRTRSIPCRSTQQLSQRSAAYHRGSNYFIQFFRAQQRAYRLAFVRSQTSQRNHGSITVTAVLMGGLIIQGLQPGPELFTRYAPMTYTFFAGFVLVQFFMLGIGLLGCRGFAQISRLSDAILIPSVAVLCVVGSFAIHKNFFDVVIMMIFGVLGYLVRKFDLNPAAIVLALILGPIGENGLRRSLRLSGGSPAILFSTPLCWVLIALCVFGVCSPIFMNRMEKKAVENAGGDIPDETGDDPVRTSD